MPEERKNTAPGPGSGTLGRGHLQDPIYQPVRDFHHASAALLADALEEAFAL